LDTSLFQIIIIGVFETGKQAYSVSKHITQITLMADFGLSKTYVFSKIHFHKMLVDGGQAVG